MCILNGLQSLKPYELTGMKIFGDILGASYYD